MSGAADNNQILQIENVSAGYGKATILNDVDLSIGRGEFFGLIGLNGAGKTTLIKTILGLRSPQQGAIKIFGEPNTAIAGKKHMAYLPERFDPPWFLSGFEFVKFSLRMYKQPYDEKAVIQAAETLALDKNALGRRVHSYSKGMRQKLGLLGTVLTGCDFLILDEPMSGLDPLARTLVKDMLLETKKKEHTIFLSSHILADLDEICDRIAVLHDGAIRYVGTPKDLKAKTSSKNLERSFLEYIEKREYA